MECYTGTALKLILPISISVSPVAGKRDILTSALVLTVQAKDIYQTPPLSQGMEKKKREISIRANGTATSRVKVQEQGSSRASL